MQKNSNFKVKSDKTLAKMTAEQLNEELRLAKDQLALTRENLALDPENQELHAQLEDLDIYIATLTELAERRGVKTEPESEESESEEEEATVNDGVYKPEAGLEDYIHVELVRGQRFDPNTGKPIGVAHKQCYTYKQFLQLQRNAKLLGYTYKLLYVPDELRGKVK